MFSFVKMWILLNLIFLVGRNTENLEIIKIQNLQRSVKPQKYLQFYNVKFIKSFVPLNF